MASRRQKIKTVHVDRARGESNRRAILEYAERYIRENGFAPTPGDICGAVFLSKPALLYHMVKLRDMGLIVWDLRGGRDLGRGWTLPKFAAACKEVK